MIFSGQGVTLLISVSWAGLIVEGADEFNDERDGVDKEKSALYSKILLVMPIFAFPPFPKSTGDCDMVTSVVGLVWDFVGTLDVAEGSEVGRGWFRCVFAGD